MAAAGHLPGFTLELRQLPFPARELPENPDLVAKLKLALDTFDLEEVKRLMTRHPELHRAPLGYAKNGPLTYAVEWPRRVPRITERLAILNWMLENGSDVHQGGDGPLMRAALGDMGIPMMELLVAHGADANARSVCRSVPAV